MSRTAGSASALPSAASSAGASPRWSSGGFGGSSGSLWDAGRRGHAMMRYAQLYLYLLLLLYIPGSSNVTEISVTQNFHYVSQYFCAFSENLRVAFLVLRLSSMKGVGNVMFSAFARVLHVFARFLRLFARVLQVDFCSFSVLPANCP